MEAEVKSLTSGLGAHAVICLANSEKAYTQSMHMLRRTGVLVCVGIPNVPFNLPATPIDMIVKGEDRSCFYLDILEEAPHVSNLSIL